MKVVVTGCSGFVGKAVVTRLLSLGHEVVGISRHDPKISGMTHFPLDLTKPTNSRFWDYKIVHCAAATEDGWSKRIETVNIEGTVNALALSGDTFVHISSSSVYDLSAPFKEIKESDFSSKIKFYNSYSYSKAVAESLVLSSRRNAAVTSLRPHGVYGEGDTTLLPRIKSNIKRNRLNLPAGGRALHSLTNINNLVDAVLLALENEEINKPTAFNISDPNQVTIADAVRQILGSVDIGEVSIETSLRFAKLIEKATASRSSLSEYTVRQIGMERTYDLSKAYELLGYKPVRFFN